MALELWRPNRFFGMEPSRELRRLERDMERFFEDFPSYTPSTSLRPLSTEAITFTPACDMNETDNHYLLSFDLPGVSRDEIKVEVIGNQLTVSGERKRESKEEKKGYYRAEREHGHFERRFALPNEVEANKVEANFQDGVLRVALPKTEAVKATTHQVKIGEGKAGWWDKLLGRSEKRDIPVSTKAA